jgi:hypothetical protein
VIAKALINGVQIVRDGNSDSSRRYSMADRAVRRGYRARATARCARNWRVSAFAQQ